MSVEMVAMFFLVAFVAMGVVAWSNHPRFSYAAFLLAVMMATILLLTYISNQLWRLQ